MSAASEEVIKKDSLPEGYEKLVIFEMGPFNSARPTPIDLDKLFPTGLPEKIANADRSVIKLLPEAIIKRGIDHPSMHKHGLMSTPFLYYGIPVSFFEKNDFSPLEFKELIGSGLRFSPPRHNETWIYRHKASEDYLVLPLDFEEKAQSLFRTHKLTEQQPADDRKKYGMDSRLPYFSFPGFKDKPDLQVSPYFPLAVAIEVIYKKMTRPQYEELLKYGLDRISSLGVASKITKDKYQILCDQASIFLSAALPSAEEKSSVSEKPNMEKLLKEIVDSIEALENDEHPASIFKHQ